MRKSVDVKTVFITGAAGFIGTALVKHFRAAGAQTFTDISSDNGTHLSSRRTLSAKSLARSLGGAVPDLVVHAAGSGTVAQVAAEPAREVPANLSALLEVLEYARTNAPQTHVVLLSSAAVYGNAPADPQNETDARSPVSLYGVSKAQAEQVIAYYAEQFGVLASVIRLFSVYGPGLRKQLLWDAMNKFAAGRADFFGTGQERRDWVHIDDVCRFMECLATTPRSSAFEVFNCGGQAASTSDVLTHLARQVRSAAPVFNGQVRAGDPMCLVADCGKALRELGWQAQIAWQNGLVEYARWFASQAGVGDLPSPNGGMSR